MTKYYYDRDGNRVPRHMAVDAKGFVKSGFSIAVAVMAADSAAPGSILVHDTPSKPTDAYDGYLTRMTRKGGQAAADAIPAKDEGSAHAGYLARMTARPGQERAA